MVDKVEESITELYRYEDAILDNLNSEPDLRLHTFEVIKTTPQGYWIYDNVHKYGKRWIHKDARKRYAYQTKELALNSFIIRKKFHLMHLLRKYRTANYSHNLAKRMHTEIKLGTKLKYDIDTDLDFDMEDLDHELENEEYANAKYRL